MVDVQKLPWHPVFGQGVSAYFFNVGQVGRLGEEDGLFAQHLILFLDDHEGRRQVRTQRFLHLLYLDLDASTAHHVVLAALDAEERLARAVVGA